jgi:methyl-accepting chemotaxis protein
MTIRRKLQILAGATVLGLGLILFSMIVGLNALHEAESAAHRRESYALMLLEIKASSLSTIMLDPTLKETREIFDAAGKNIGDQQGKILGVIRRPEIREELKQILGKWTKYEQDSQQLIQLAASDAKSANERLVPVYNEQFKPFGAALEKFVADRLVDAEQAREQARAVSSRVYWTIVPLVVLVGCINIALVLLLSVTLQRALVGILQKLSALRQGDLTQRLPTGSNDELGEIASGVNEFVDEMQGIVRKVLAGAGELSSAASQLASTARMVASSSASQSDSAAATAAAIEQMSVSVSSIADTTGEVRQLSASSLEDARKGTQSVAELQQEISKVQVDVHAIATQVGEFLDSTRSIAGMTQQIREIADQTNLLALNAAIEAARAGEQGRGFAVVADEVRQLAERSSKSAGEITSVTEVLNGKSGLVNHSIEGGLKSLSASLVFVGSLAQVLADASQSVQKTSSGVDDVTASVQEQKIASAEIARNVELIAQAADSNRSASRESAEASSRLEQLAVSLTQMIGRYKV